MNDPLEGFTAEHIDTDSKEEFVGHYKRELHKLHLYGKRWNCKKKFECRKGAELMWEVVKRYTTQQPKPEVKAKRGRPRKVEIEHANIK